MTVTVTVARNQVALTPDDLRLLIAVAQDALAWNEDTYLCVYPKDPAHKFAIIPKTAFDAEMDKINRRLKESIP